MTHFDLKFLNENLQNSFELFINRKVLNCQTHFFYDFYGNFRFVIMLQIFDIFLIIFFENL
mgnify:CR=1 FL=1